VLNHLRICKGTGVLIVPLRRSALFWPLLWDFDGNKFNSFVVDKMEFQKPNNFFVVGSDKNSIICAKHALHFLFLSIIAHAHSSNKTLLIKSR
jgi:hypothetical protein